MPSKKVEAPNPCATCGDTFMIYPWQLVRDWGRFCSVSCGSKSRKAELNGGWRDDDITYEAMHYRLRAQKGKPGACTSCSAPAKEWAYTHDDPDERRCPKGRPFSTDPDRYVPMCRSCHRKEDNNRRKPA